MPASQKKIITKLRQRRQIEADLRRMLTASSELEFQQRAQRIAALGSEVIPAIIGNLDGADAQMLAAMGAVAALLERDQVTTALRQVVLQPQSTDRGRVGAMNILERFLGQAPDDNLLASLVDPESIAISSLEEVLGQVQSNPAILIEYARGLDQQEPDVVLAVLGTLRRLSASSGQRTGPAVKGSSRQAVEPLRMMAQDVRDEIAAEALQILGTIRLPEAARALQTLVPIVAPELRPLAERLLRKLQFVGVQVRPLLAPTPTGRALVSALDGLGRQNVWFIQENEGTASAQFLNVLLSDRAGAVEAVGHTQVPRLILPPRRPQGHLHDIALPDGSGAMLMLEASFDFGRRLVLEALALNRETQIPVAATLRLLSPWLWRYSGADSLPPGALPVVSAEDRALTGRLVEHPAFATWVVGREAVFRVAEQAWHHPGWGLDVWVGRLVDTLFADPMVAQVFHRRLLVMSEWLLLAGDETESRLALAAAEAIVEGDPQELPFVQALVRRDLELTLSSLGQKSKWMFGIEQVS